MATRTINWGDKVRGTDIPKFSGTQAMPSVISVIAKEGIRASQTHYIEKMGHFHCFEGVCCSDAGKATIRYLLPVVVYRLKNPATYEIDLSKGVEVMYHAMNEKDYDKLMAQDAQIPIDQCDFLVTTVEQGNFKNYTFQLLMDPSTRTARQATWRNDEHLRLVVMQHYNSKYNQFIDNSVGREFKTTQAYQEARNKALQMAGQSANSQPQLPQAGPPPVYLPSGSTPATGMIGGPVVQPAPNTGMLGATSGYVQPTPAYQQPPITVQSTPVQSYVDAPPAAAAVMPPPTAVPPTLEGGMSDTDLNNLMQ